MSQLLDQHGQPIREMVAHEAADTGSLELAGWAPSLLTADEEILPEWGTMVARTRDMIRNHGLASGAVQMHLDAIIGPQLKLACKPDYRALGLDAAWAAEWSRQTESQWYQFAENIDGMCDAGRTLTVSGIVAQSYRSYLTSGDIFVSGEWMPTSGRQFATAFQVIDPERVSNPDGRPDRNGLRGGVQRNRYGAPVGYWIRSDDDRFGFTLRRWRYVRRETGWGRQQIIHLFDQERPGQSRGKTGFVAVLGKLKMLEKYEKTALQAAILNAVYAATIESPMDWASVGTAIGATSDSGGSLANYLQQRSEFHKTGNVRYNGLKIPHLFPGEKFNLQAPQHPNAAFNQFEEAVLRHIAGGLNLSYEQLARDYSKSNYSSARAAMLETWRFFEGRRHRVAARLATQLFALWLEEAMDLGVVETPKGAPDFWAAKTAWTRCRWIGPGRGHIDPLKEENATKVRYELGLTSLEHEAAERGHDWEELLEQRAMEKKRAQELGLTADDLPGMFGRPAVARPAGNGAAAIDDTDDTDEEGDDA